MTAVEPLLLFSTPVPGREVSPHIDAFALVTSLVTLSPALSGKAVGGHGPMLAATAGSHFMFGRLFLGVKN